VSRKIKFSWAWLIFLAIGLFAGYSINKIPLIEFDKTIDLAEVLNILIALITLGVAVHISHVLERRKKKEEYTFEFLVQKVDEIKKNIQTLLSTINQSDTPIYIINSKLKNISMSYLDLKDIMETVEIDIQQDAHNTILKQIKHIKHLSTENAVYKFGTNTIAYNDEQAISINDSKLSFSSDRIDQISSFSKNLINNVFHLIVK